MIEDSNLLTSEDDLNLAKDTLLIKAFSQYEVPLRSSGVSTGVLGSIDDPNFGKTYAGVAGEARKDTTGEQALRFGWDPAHKHPHIKQEMDFLFGSTILTAPDGTQLACDHLRHGDDWRLRCKRPDSKEVVMRRVRE